MKSISAPAMAAIEAGEAIVTGAVEFTSSLSGAGSGPGPGQWRYKVVTLADTTDYSDPDFDDSDWDAGEQPFCSSNAIVPPATEVPVEHSYWLRKLVPSSVAGIEFYVDDTSTVWYNGVELSQTYITGDAISPGSREVTFPEELIADSNSLVVRFNDTQTGILNGTEFIVSTTLPDVDDGSSIAIRVWGGYGPIEIDGEIYQGIGDRGLAQQTAGAIGGFAQGLTLTLSGIEPEVLDMLDSNEIKGASVVLRRLIFASDGKTLLDAHIFDRGRVDTVETDETIGSGAAIKVAVETAARGLGRSGARQRSDSDQRLINVSDGYFKNAAYAGEKMLYWGGRKPSRTGDATGGSTLGGSGSFSRLIM